MRRGVEILTGDKTDNQTLDQKGQGKEGQASEQQTSFIDGTEYF